MQGLSTTPHHRTPSSDPAEPFWGARLERLVGRYGVVNTVHRRTSPRGLGELALVAAMLGSGLPGSSTAQEQAGCAGRALDDPALARALALAEAAERYAAWDPEDTRYVRARPADLPGRVARYQDFARCSADEYAHPACPVAPFDPDAEIRWVKGVDLADGAEIWVPACMATYRLAKPGPGERFWYRISTGHAVHTDPAAAVFGALAEVVERDAIALLWLQRLPLPHIPQDALGPDARRLLRWCHEHHLEVVLLDATTDIGLPVSYAVLHAPHDPMLHNLVGCSAGLDHEETVVKALLEVIGLRTALPTGVTPPERFEDFRAVADGARYTGRAEYGHAFDFLLRPHPDRPTFQPRGRYASGPRQALDRLRTTLTTAGLETMVVDRTTDELAEVGLTAVAALVPGLQPMSLRPLAQFRDHPRLFTAPGRMGYRALPPEELNPLPQPFA
jgi:ribosomal protein S12 methylthiotransferase accessory factor